SGPVRVCRACKCSDNIDPNAVGNCNRETGECLKCIYNTDGFFCDRCQDGFYGNPLASSPTDKCKAALLQRTGRWVDRQLLRSPVSACRSPSRRTQRCEPASSPQSASAARACTVKPDWSPRQCDINAQATCEWPAGARGLHCSAASRSLQLSSLQT
ncbi:unnamed protein product, partial [Pleuronectes platessa]